MSYKVDYDKINLYNEKINRGIKMKKRKLFCEYGPAFYKISLLKETLKKDFKDFKAGRSINSIIELVKSYNELRGNNGKN